MMKKAMAGRKLQRGFTLLEVLVSILILSVGLLGMAGLQLMSLKQNSTSYVRSQASLLADDIMDRMRANRTSAEGNNYNIALGDSAPSGSSLADVDVSGWLGTVGSTMPGGDGSVSCSNSLCVITLQWSEAGDDGDDDGVITRQFVLTTEI